MNMFYTLPFIMRAKEYLEINKSEILRYDIVKKSIDDLCLLRNNSKNTETYFNKYLFSDIRYHLNPDEFELWEGEVAPIYALQTRMYIKNAILSDESFIYANNIIALQKNDYCQVKRLDECKVRDFTENTKKDIENFCRFYKDDYPKTSVEQFFKSKDNRHFYCKKRVGLNKSNKWWLKVFNEAYAIFDDMRQILFRSFDAKELITKFENEDKDFENTVVELVRFYLNSYDYDLSQEQIDEIHFLSEELDLHFSQVERQSTRDKTKELKNILKESEIEYETTIKSKDEKIESLEIRAESLEQEIESKNQEIESLRNQLKQQEKPPKSKGLTIVQINIFFYYMFDKMGINFENNTKTQWAKLISRVVGKNEENIRKALCIKFDNPATQKDMRRVADVTDDLLPYISNKILNDLES